MAATDETATLKYPGGELDLTPVCQPGRTHRLSLRVVAMPLKAVMLSYGDSASAREIKGAVARLAGQEIPKFEDNETTMAELRELDAICGERNDEYPETAAASADGPGNGTTA